MKHWTTGKVLVAVAALALLALEVRNLFDHGNSAADAARRTRCMNNLKQIGMSISQYCQPPVAGPLAFGPYPSGTVDAPDIPADRRCGWASLIYLLDHEGCSGCPFISSQLAWDVQESPGRDGHMYCPSCPKPSGVTPRVPAAYVGIAGLGGDAPALPTTDRRAGIFGDARVVTPGDVKDGLAETMMIVDSSSPAGPWFAGGRNTVRGLDPARAPYIGKGQQFGGNHGDGANVLMADGSIRYVKDSVDPKVFEALSTIAGGEKVSVPRD